MRPIEFRVWDVDNNKLRYHGDGWEGDIVVPIYDNSSTEMFIVTQFTGLFDKNGKKIFEGDFLTGRRNPILVEYDPPEFRFIYKELGCFWFAGWGDIYEPEIIGNIFENQEMYKEHKILPKREILSK